jgi:hypothetical protein
MTRHTDDLTPDELIELATRTLEALFPGRCFVVLLQTDRGTGFSLGATMNAPDVVMALESALAGARQHLL